jgi:hypothetical protein
MLKRVMLLYGLAWSVPVAAQFDLGASFGLARYDIRAREGEGHAGASFSDLSRPDLTASIYYREQHGSHTNLGLELSWARKEFRTSYASGSLLGSAGTSAHVVLHTLNVAILPEVRLAERSGAVIRFGLSCGFRIAGSMTGSTYAYWPYQSYQADLVDEVPRDFGGELRVIMGFGFRIPTGQRSGITVDPYGAYGISSMLKVEPGSVTTELGLRLGWSLRMPSGGMTRWLDRHTPTPPSGPNW